MNVGASIIEVTSLSRRFASVQALDSVSFAVPRGTVFGFLGPNGAGKTTVIRTLLGLIPPSAGGTRVFGLDPMTQGDAIRARCGALLEHHGLYERLSAIQNLSFAGRVWHMTGAAVHERARELLSRFGLWERRDDIVGTWSRGMKQKLAVARAVLHSPELVFLDEPTAGLDPVASASLRDDLDALSSERQVTIFLTTHNLAEAERLCDLVGVIRKGRLVGLDTPDELRSRRRAPVLRIEGRGLTGAAIPLLQSVTGVRTVELDGTVATIHLADGASASPVVEALVHAGIEVEEVIRERATFEEAFLELVRSDGEVAT
ncbi:MAG: ATP-binding cassette domain-containing protein [Gemmatimonadota bacterium]